MDVPDPVILAYAIGGIVAMVGGVLLLVWLQGKPQHRAWAWPALAIAVGGALGVAFGVVPPVVLWLMLGAP